ncbi:MAG TPA: zf-HC2 domain-containing protein [Candidatus Acidoferrales bacterium]|nr:zf-HC2 domain-containing protein [Candidatus Acidoferrales bacterium]
MKHKEAAATMAAERYVLGELHDTELEQFEEHFFSCPECAEDVRDLSDLTAGARELLQQPRNAEPPKQRAAAPATGWRWPWPRLSPSFAWGGAMAAVTLVAVTTGYQAAHLSGLVRPQAVASFLLKPAARGEEAPAASIQVRKSGSFFILETYLPGFTGDLQWELRRAGSEKVIDQQTAPAPNKNITFKFLLPSSMAPGEYTLTVRSTLPSEKPSYIKFKIT